VRKKEKNKDKMVLKQESKNDIQELFNELFVGELNKKIADMSQSTSGSINKLEIIEKQNKQYYTVICDVLEALQADFRCLGNTEAWGDNSLITSLNQIAALIDNCKEEEEKLIGFIGTKWEGKSVYDSLDYIEKHVLEIAGLVKRIEQQNMKSEFDKLYEKIKQNDDIVLKLEKLQGAFETVKKEFESEGMVSELYKKADIIISVKIIIEEISNKLGVLGESYKELITQISENETMRKNAVQMLDEKISQNWLVVEEKIDSCLTKNRRNFIYVVSGLATQMLFNILMIILLLIK